MAGTVSPGAGVVALGKVFARRRHGARDTTQDTRTAYCHAPQLYSYRPCAGGGPARGVRRSLSSRGSSRASLPRTAPVRAGVAVLCQREYGMDPAKVYAAVQCTFRLVVRP